MTNTPDAASLAAFLHCLSSLEVKTFHLYKVLSDKVEPPLVKSLLFSIASDSQKHAVLLKGVANSIGPKNEAHSKDCEKRIGETLQLITALGKEIDAKERIDEEELPQFIKKLTCLESTAGEEYSIFVQLRTLEIMATEIKRLYNVDISGVKDIFESIIEDEEHHREVLASIRDLIHQKNEDLLRDDPLMEYRALIGRST